MGERVNAEGIPRHQLKHALTDRRFVPIARRIDACLLCRDGGVNEAGLCPKCWSQLSDEELALAQRWLMGAIP